MRNASWTQFIKDGAQYSPTEELGLSFINDNHKNILSIGISTAGFAELRMALFSEERKIIATTLDKDGLEFTKNLVHKYKVENQIQLKIEDISADLSYEKDSFDFVYARLVLHYLEKKKLQKSLKSIYNILDKDGEAFIVVRAYDWESEVEGAKYDLDTEITTYPIPNFNKAAAKYATNVRYSSRHLHSVGSISAYLEQAGFKIKSLDLFSETIFSGFEREAIKKNRLPANLIAIYLEKKI